MAEMVARGSLREKTEIKKHLKTLDWISLILVVVGGLNWGLVAIANLNFVAALFGELSVVSRIVYLLVALSAIYLIFVSSRLTRK